MNKKNVVIFSFSVIVLCVCLFLFFTNLKLKTAAADNDAAIKDVVVNAIECTHGSLTQIDENVTVTDDLKNSMLNKVETSLNGIYSSKSPMLATRINSVRGVINSETKEDKDLGGGIRSINNEKISIDKDTATYEADIRVWSRLLDQGKVFTPENTCHYVFTLANENGQWKITGETFDFLPGQEP